MKKKLRVYIFFIFCLVLAFPFSGRADETLDIANGDVEITEEGTYKITGTTNANKVVVNAEGLEVNITISGLNIDVSETEHACAFDIQAGTVNLILEEENVLKSGEHCAGLHISKDSELIINGEGKLNATSQRGAGIGGNPNSEVGNITIDGGNVIAIGEDRGAGIGGDYESTKGTIKITGGSVKAKGGDTGGAGIGSGGDSNKVDKIEITGGVVDAESISTGAGIGSGGNQKGVTTIIITGGNITARCLNNTGAGIGGYARGNEEIIITITGGNITAIGGRAIIGGFYFEGDGIGKGYGGKPGTFSTQGGNAFIIASSISDNSEEKKENWQGVIFEGDEGHIYGNPTIATNAEIPTSKKLIIDEGQKLVLAEGVTLTNKGEIVGEDKITLSVTYHKNYDTDESKIVEAAYNSAPAYSDFTRLKYSIDGWYDKESGGQKVEKITGSIDLYANWKKNEIKLVESLTALEGAYGKEIDKYNLSDLLSVDSYKEKISYKLTGENYGLSILNNQITGIPTKAAAEGSIITITIGSEDCENIIDAKVPINIAKGKSSIDGFASISDLTYNGNAVDITAPTVKDESGNQIDGATAELSYQIKTGNNQYEPTSANNSGAEDDGKAPKYAGEYKVTASFAGNDNYAVAEVNQTAEFIIKKAALTITPLSDQIVLPNETKDFKPKYKVTGAVNNEKPLFNGDLKLDRDGETIVNNNLILNDLFDKNYSMTIIENVTVTILNNTVANDKIVLSGTTEDNAYIDQVTIKAPEGFLIKLVSYTQTKAVDGFDKSFPWNKIGTFEISYKLKRIDGDQESDTYTITVTVEEKKAEPDTPVIPPVEPEEPPTHYTVTLPSVVGATTDPAAGDYEVEEGDSFRFRLTLDKDYDLSKPVVTTDYGAVIASQGEDGVYVINQVSRSFEIRIDGVVKNPDPVANTEIQSGIKVWGNNHRLFIRTDRPEEVAVYTFSGQLQKKFRSEVGDRFISLPSGTYIVLIGDKRFKVIL